MIVEKTFMGLLYCTHSCVETYAWDARYLGKELCPLMYWNWHLECWVFGGGGTGRQLDLHEGGVLRRGLLLLIRDLIRDQRVSVSPRTLLACENSKIACLLGKTKMKQKPKRPECETLMPPWSWSFQSISRTMRATFLLFVVHDLLYFFLS